MLWILIPAKPTWLAKQRLAPVLGGAERAALHHWLVANTLTQVRASGITATILVVTADSAIAALAQAAGAATLPDPAGADLNAALEAGRDYAIAHGATALLVLPTDLPYLTPDALNTLIAHAPEPAPCLLIAPDHQGTGTNALLLRPAAAIPFAFGVGSAVRHRAAAHRQHLHVVEYHDPALAHDLDTPEDYAMFAGDWERVSFIDNILTKLTYSQAKD